MSDIEKEEAINSYLCEHITYDDAALESAKNNNYKYADAKFDDSFTVYGALHNNVCVCIGYAETFKTLADLAGLDSLVVTGTIGSIGHAWNKINISGEWLTIDVTNNDSEAVPNALFNLPDSAAELMLVENNKYILDANASKYCGSSSTDSEYYHLTHNYFDKDELAQVLCEKLSTPFESITVRTDFNITDDELYDLLYPVAQNTSSFTFINNLGVIHIENAS